jgi:hypothetical protein
MRGGCFEVGLATGANERRAKMRERWHELWATFSVKDHCTPGAFVAESLLFDHLLIPVVPMRRDGLSAEEASLEWKRWQDKGWEPGRLNQLVAILGERATPIPWTQSLQREWQERMNPSSEPSTMAATKEVQRARSDGYLTTGSVLERFAPRMAQTVVAVSEYHSIEDLQRSTPIRRADSVAGLPAGSLLAVVGHELLVPADPDRDDFQLLAEAAEVGSDRAYREKRKLLYLWQQEFVGSDGLTDTQSITRAVEHMSDLVSDLNAATRMQGIWRGVKKLFAFLKVGEKAGALVQPAGATALGAAISVGDFVLDRTKPDIPSDEATPVAALLLDAQKRLGLTITGDRRA